MIRRRRRIREIPFSFDSFLDVVANVVGIIIRLILVVWVGARSYDGVVATSQQAKKEIPAEKSPPNADPLLDELARQRGELARAQALLLEQLRQIREIRDNYRQEETRLALVKDKGQNLDQEAEQWIVRGREVEGVVNAAKSSFENLRSRREHLTEEIQTLNRLPPLKKVVTYRTPVSRPVNSEEFLFECHQGRVTFVDIGTLLGDVRQRIEEKGKELRDRWELTDEVGPVGAFRLRYTLEREREALDAALPSGVPEATGNYRYGLSEWILEPVAFPRGETLESALKEKSDFSQIISLIDPHQGVVTFWVYPDSFDLYRRLRDYLYERDIVVAGRPLPEGVLITSSKRGSVSRGQ